MSWSIQDVDRMGDPVDLHNSANHLGRTGSGIRLEYANVKEKSLKVMAPTPRWRLAPTHADSYHLVLARPIRSGHAAYARKFGQRGYHVELSKHYHVAWAAPHHRNDLLGSLCKLIGAPRNGLCDNRALLRATLLQAPV